MDTKTDWGIVLKRSKDSTKRVGHSKVVAPLGSSGGGGGGGSMMSGGIRGRTGGIGGGMKDHRRDSRGRFPPHQMYRNTRPFDYGRYISGLIKMMMQSVRANEQFMKNDYMNDELKATCPQKHHNHYTFKKKSFKKPPKKIHSFQKIAVVWHVI